MKASFGLTNELGGVELSSNEASSAGHKLGQIIGDWFEEYFVLPLLGQVALKLNLFLDNRFVIRPARASSKILWRDEYNNSVDYDCVLELGGTPAAIGIPVAFIECFWRRGARHSKDKARDDSGKLLPMRHTYPTARFLGIVSGGDFTEPARELVRSRDIDLFYVPKDKVVDAFLRRGLVIDYPDKAPEQEKTRLAAEFTSNFSPTTAKEVADTLIELIGEAVVASYVDRVRARLAALPQEIRIVLRHESTPMIFKSVSEVTDFLRDPTFRMDEPRESFIYQITYSDGTEFEQSVKTVDEIRLLHSQIEMLTDHVRELSQTEQNKSRQS